MINKERVAEIFSNLIKINSVNPPGNEQVAAEYLYKLFCEVGIPCSIQQLGENRANFAATIGRGSKMLDFNGHLDTVPFTDDWDMPPLQTTEKDGKMYGRGSCDMKSGVAAMCEAMLSLYEENVDLKGRLRLVFVADEEVSNIGIRTFLKQNPPADFAVIGEPTDLAVAVAHRGVIRHDIYLYGEASHAALRPTNITAMEKATKTLAAIEQMNRELKETMHTVLPSPSIAVTKIEGYEKDNIIPAKVTMLTDYRILPGTSRQHAMEQLHQYLQRVGIGDCEIQEHFFMPGGEVLVNEPFVNLCCEVTGAYHPNKAQPVGFNASCEQCFMIEAGTKAVICGPGSLAQAHTVNEYVEKEQLFDAAEIYKTIAQKVLS